ncbi:MAG: hypothetical protein OXD31_09250 [Chloroflexi bacterium]|nr:hypothetical protein [Chloroflexota bacterium]
MKDEHPAALPWEVALIEGQGLGSLVNVAREGRLSRRVGGTVTRVELNLIDESMLALVDAALSRRYDISFVYPAAAGEVSALLAAQILISRLLSRHPSPSVGIVTADVTPLARVWNEITFGNAGGRAPISDVFPCVRTGPDGVYERTRSSFRGVMVGRRFADWPVDVVIRDRLGGLVDGSSPQVPTIDLYADPFDSSLEDSANRGALVWSWGIADLGTLQSFEGRQWGSRLPFSVANDRLSTVADGIARTIHVAHNEEAERASKALKDDLLTIRQMAGGSPKSQLLRGLRAAWHHYRTLQAMPVRPSQFDRFSGVPPVAARPTSTYEPELSAWARSVGGEIGELAEIIAGDIADLRVALEASPPFIAEISEMVHDLGFQLNEPLFVVKNATAMRALVDELGGDVRTGAVGSCRFVSVRTLHRSGTWKNAFVIGMPPRWEWHRLDSGICRDLHLLVLGDDEASACVRSLESLWFARQKWSSADRRTQVWRKVIGESTPPRPRMERKNLSAPKMVGAARFIEEPNPFEAFESLLMPGPLFSEEGPSDTLAERGEDGRWRAEVDAVEVVTDAGTILFPKNRAVDARVRTSLESLPAYRLSPGMFLILNRQAGSAGLLNAVSERMRAQRPDLYVVNLLIRDLGATTREGFRRSGFEYAELHRRLVRLGFDKTYQAARGYVREDGPIAPRDFSDLKMLNSVLDLGYDGNALSQTFQAVQRERTFRRALGRSLAEAARKTAVSSMDDVIDDETGLSISDLTELVLEAKVVRVLKCTEPVPLNETGFLRRE